MPKYILKRIFPEDCIKLKDDGIEIIFNNILAPFAIENIPEDYLANVTIKVDGVDLPHDLMEQATVTINDNQVPATNIKELEGQTVPVGGKIIIFAPMTELNGVPLQVGDEHEFDVIITWGDGHDEYGPLTRKIS